MQHRHRSTTGAGDRGAGPEPRGLKGRITAHDVGPDQAEREKIDDEHRPQRRNAHRNPRTRAALPHLLSNSPPMTIPIISWWQDATATFNGLSPRKAQSEPWF